MGRRLGMFSIVVLACCLFAAGTAFATPTLYNTVPAGLADNSSQSISITLDRTWTGKASGYLNGQPVDWYTGYAFNFTYNGTNYDELNSFCVDPADSTTASMSPYYIESLSYAFNNSVPANYAESAWLLDQAMLGNVNPVTAQVAAWVIMFQAPSAYTYSQYQNGTNSAVVQDLVTQAENNYNSLNLDGFYIATSPYADPSSSFGVRYQDYLFHVPEPSTLLLLSLGLLGMAGYRSRRRAMA